MRRTGDVRLRGQAWKEGRVDVLTSFVADDQATEPGDSRQGPLDRPAVAARTLTIPDPVPRDARDDAAPLVSMAAAQHMTIGHGWRGDG